LTQNTNKQNTKHNNQHTCITTRRVVALFQSLLSSRHRMMYSRCAILARTMPSTCFAAVCRPMLRLPGAGEIRPFVVVLFRVCLCVVGGVRWCVCLFVSVVA
jgi:hypothetical protein